MPDRTAGRCASRHACAVVISTETESGFITWKMTRLQSVTLQVPEVGKNPVDTAYDVGSVVAADTSIRPTCFSEAYYTAPIKVRQLLVPAAGYVFRGILSLNIVYQSHQIRLDSRTALSTHAFRTPPSCATNMRIAHLALSHWLSKF
ncbi:hypothetical protein TNCV_4447111 [Trichonephila clavipes]|nr:hypothetical protein TNCV_4447111 [Trichonephila clavipes]